MKPGTRIGPYEITGAIGAGGMGEVYRARDTRLDRDVAVKSLPMGFDADPDRVARFEREAKTLASLNHANIAQVYGLEQGDSAVIVMELVEGEDLAERLERGALPLDEALPIARQIAEALAAAHEAGIIHRDLKPANVKVRPDGTVKVLDFGLAKADPASPSSISGATQSPTMMSPAISQAGVILGTAAYMSPEQARGRAVDRRADVFAFGCVLLELITGQRAFEGEDVTEVLAAVIKDTPPLDAVPADTPRSIRRLLRRCLEKDPKVRLDSMRAAVLEIDEAAVAEDVAVAPAAAAAGGWRQAALALAAALAITVAGATYLLLQPSNPADAPLTHLEIDLPGSSGSISPDGRTVASENGGSVVLRRLDQTELRTVVDYSVRTWAWAPDSRRFVFRDGTALRTGDIVGSPPRTICDACVSDQTRGMSWDGQETVLVGLGTGGGIHAIEVSTGESRAITVLDPDHGENSHRFPWFLPDGRRFLFAIRTDSGEHSIALGSLDGEPPTRLVSAFSETAYAAGHLLFVRDDTLYAQPFDLDAAAALGDPVAVVPEIRFLPSTGSSWFSVAGPHALLYFPPAAQTIAVWVDRQGRELERPDLPADGFGFGAIRSYDGKRFAITVGDETVRSTDIYVFDTDTGAQTRVTDDPRWDQNAAWSADGNGIFYQSQRDERPGVYFQPLDGGTERFINDARVSQIEPSPNGAELLLVTAAGIERVSLEAPAERQLWHPDAGAPSFSPDGRHVAYVSSESGSRQLYIRPLDGQGRHRVATPCAAGSVRWGHDGREIYFHCNEEMIAVPVQDAAALRFGDPEPLFSLAAAVARFGFEVDPNGRFLIRRIADTEHQDAAGIILNWTRMLESQR